MKNIVLIVVDTLRPDHLGCYGHDRPTSPRLDELAAGGARLDALWSASNFTAPAFTSLFTGLYPHQHGVFDFTSRTNVDTVKRTLEANGARMGAAVSFRFFRNLLGEVWDDISAVTDTRSYNYAKDLPGAVTEESLEWLEKYGSSGPFCLFVHYDGPHMPYRLPDEYATFFDTVDPARVDPDFLEQLFPQHKPELDDSNTDSMFRLLNEVAWGRRRLQPDTLQWMRDKYDASVRYNDAAIGDLLDGLDDLGLADDTIVAVLSDHGEEFHEHGNLGHAGVHLYEEVVRTVGIIRDPAKPANGRGVDRPLSQTDVWPTLLELAGAEAIPESWTQRSFAPLLDPDVEPIDKREWGPDDAVYCQGQFKQAVRWGPHKYIVARPVASFGRGRRMRFWLKMLLQRKLGEEMYDLSKDPRERKNVAREKWIRSGPIKSMRSLLARHLARASARPDAVTDADEEQRKRIEKEMKDLGYM